MPTPTITETPSPTRISTPTRTPTATPIRTGWVFEKVQLAPAPIGNSLELYGELLNDTGQMQEVTAIDGKFFNARGKMIADSINSDTLSS